MNDETEVGPWWLPPWIQTVGEHNSAVDLTRAALYLSAHGCTHLSSMNDVGQQLERIDRITELASIAHAGNSHFDSWHRLCFGTLQLTGDQVDFHDPRNSYLPDIMTRRVGIPIGLCVLALEFGQRLGVDCWGVGMPGHFLIGARQSLTGDEVFIDAFDGGSVLDADGCREKFHQLFGSDRSWSSEFLRPTDGFAMLIRMVANLKQHAARRRDLTTLCNLARLRWFLPGMVIDEGRELVRLCVALGALDEAPTWLDQLVIRFGHYPGFDTDQRILTAASN